MDATTTSTTAVPVTTTINVTTAAPTSTSRAVTSSTAPPATLPAQAVVEQRTIGTSVGGRAIVALHKPGSTQAAHRVLVVGEIHGEEPAGRTVVAQLVAMHIPESVDLWLIPTVNPDGGAIGRRTNDHGVDLNRNFPTRWEAPGGPNTSNEHNSGSGPASEPETQGVMAFIASVHPDVTIWYHQPYHWVDCDQLAMAACKPYSALVGYAITHQDLPGTATDWEITNGYGMAFVVEFSVGAISSSTAARHANAAVSV